MTCAFFHDVKLRKGNDKQIYSIAFTYEVWQRYLMVFDSLIVSTRIRKKTVNDKNTALSSGDRVKFNPITKYHRNSDAILNKKEIRNQIRETIAQCDFAIIRLPSIIGMIAYKEIKKTRKPFLVEVVGCAWDALWNHSIKGKLIALPYYMGMKKIVMDSKYAIYVTNEFLQKRYPTKGKTIGISNVELQPLKKDIIERRINKIKNMEDTRATILGTIAAVDVRYKGQEYVIKAISKLNREGYNFEYHLVGGGDNTYLKSVAHKYNVRDKVKFLGILSHEEVFDYLGSIDIYIQPSRQEGLPRALIEAMSTGCPSMGSTTAGIPELLDSKYIFNNGAVEEICKLLKKTGKNEMVREARRNFEKAKEYDKKVLDNRRKEFLIQVLKDIEFDNM